MKVKKQKEVVESYAWGMASSPLHPLKEQLYELASVIIRLPKHCSKHPGTKTILEQLFLL